MACSSNTPASVAPPEDTESEQKRDVPANEVESQAPSWGWQIHHCRKLMSALHRLVQIHGNAGRTALQAHHSGLLNALNGMATSASLMSPTNGERSGGGLLSPLTNPTADQNGDPLQLDMHSLRKELSDWYDMFGHRKVRA